MADRIAELRIEGLRSIEKLHLPLSGPTVLIGENGSGKSTIIEACQLLRATARPEFSSAFYGVHGGMFGLLRWGAKRLTLGARIESDSGDVPLDYEIVFLDLDGSAVIHGESIRTIGGDLVMERLDPTRIRLRGQGIIGLSTASEPGLASVGSFGVDPQILRVRTALEHIETHVAFETTPLWAARARSRRCGLRTALPIQRTDRLDLFGDNLPNAYYALAHDYGDSHWKETLGYVRLGLGQDVERVTTMIDPGGGSIGLGLDLRGRGQVPASALSDGQLAYLAFVALYRLKTPRSLMAFDEPDLHLHPGLLARVVQFFESMSERHPVILAVQSDALLDSLAEPARAVRVCELEQPSRRTVVRSLDAGALDRWLKDYRGVGHVRSDGFLSQVLEE